MKRFLCLLLLPLQMLFGLHPAVDEVRPPLKKFRNKPSYAEQILPALVGFGAGILASQAWRNNKKSHSNEAVLSARIKELEDKIKQMVVPPPTTFRILFGLYINLDQAPQTFSMEAFDPFKAASEEENSLITISPLFYTPDNSKHMGFSTDYNSSSGSLSDTVSVDSASSGLYKIGYQFDCGNYFRGVAELKTTIYVLTHQGMAELPAIEQSIIEQLAPNSTVEWTVDFYFSAPN